MADAGVGAAEGETPPPEPAPAEDEDMETRVEGICQVLQTQSPSDPEFVKALVTMRRLLSSTRGPPIEPFITRGIAPTLIEVASNKDVEHTVRYEALWALTNLASGTTDQTTAVINAGAIQLCADELQNAAGLQRDILEQIVWLLGNLMGDGPRARDLALDAGVLTPLAALMTAEPPHPLNTVRNIMWSLSNCCRGKPPPNLVYLREVLPTLVAHIRHPDSDVLADCLWAISYMSDASDEAAALIIESGCVPRLMECIGADEHVIVTPALRCVGNLLTGTDAATEYVLGQGLLPALRPLIATGHTRIAKEAAWSLSNVAAGTPAQIEQILGADIIPGVMRLARHNDFAVAKESMWVLANMCGGATKEQIPRFPNLLEMFDIFAMFLSKTEELKMVEATEDALTALLDKCPELVPQVQGTACQEQLAAILEREDLPFPAVQLKANFLMDTYFMAFPPKAAVTRDF